MTIKTYAKINLDQLATEAFFNAYENGIGWSAQVIGTFEIMATIDAYDGYTEYAIVQNDEIILWSENPNLIAAAVVALI
jgi:hypothetical protein